jgi:hypothetical protein
MGKTTQAVVVVAFSRNMQAQVVLAEAVLE